ncbi:MAG: hypothetical protein KGK00_13750 [Paracoccaceae bacterium]|nr:hypothetical protein [Paracoccaceae bacterium]
MITRYAMFEGSVPADKEDAFRAAVRAELVPKWRAFPGARAVRVGFTVARDDGAPAFPLILAIDYDDRAAVETALASPVRAESRAATESVLARFFTGRIHHHVTEAESFAT